jgi:hypothetical protein
MAISVTTNPVTLTWANFTVVTNLVDPHDNTPQDAVTAFNYDIPDRPPRQINGRWFLAETFTITITPNAKVRQGAAQTAALLVHEQLHYDVGTVIARRLARELEQLSARDLPTLRQRFIDCVNLHFHRRAGLIQRRYDLDTNHSLNKHYQKVWEKMMRDCLANPRSTMIGGFYL